MREREGEREGGREGERGREREIIIVLKVTISYTLYTDFSV